MSETLMGPKCLRSEVSGKQYEGKVDTEEDDSCQRLWKHT